MANRTKQSSSRSDRTAPRAGEHAIVIGGSMAGLLAARVLSDSYDRVTVLDRDGLPEGVTENRRAVPQGRHAHGLQLGGQVALEELLPGFCEETKEAGAPALLRASRCASRCWAANSCAPQSARRARSPAAR